MHRSCPCRISHRGRIRQQCMREKEPCLLSGSQHISVNALRVNGSRLTSFTRATHLTCRFLRSNASWSSLTTSLLIAFFAEKPFVHVRRKPLSSAVCSTGNEKVRPRGIAGDSLSIVFGLSGDRGDSGSALNVRNLSTESAR